MARRTSLPPAVERLIDHLGSVGALELLMLLRNAHGRGRTLAEICEALRCPERWAALQLRRLAETGLVESDREHRFAYRPATAALNDAVSELARLWDDDRGSVTSRMLVARPPAPDAPA